MYNWTISLLEKLRFSNLCDNFISDLCVSLTRKPNHSQLWAPTTIQKQPWNIFDDLDDQPNRLEEDSWWCLKWFNLSAFSPWLQCFFQVASIFFFSWYGISGCCFTWVKSPTETNTGKCTSVILYYRYQTNISIKFSMYLSDVVI